MPNDQPQQVILYRRDPAANMARFYVLSIEESLFGEAALVREWGRIGTAGRRRVELHEDGRRAAQALAVWLRRKQRRGYRLRWGG